MTLVKRFRTPYMTKVFTAQGIHRQSRAVFFEIWSLIMPLFKVALVGLDGQTVPDWVYERFAQEHIAFAVRECISREELAEVAGDADIVWVFGSHRCVYAENLDVIPRCGAIIRTGSGTDNVPVAEATRRGIIVANTPDAVSDAVAEHTIGLLFACIRQIAVQDRAVRRGTWDRYLAWPGWHLQGQTLGLIGFGRIPQFLVRKLRGFDLRVLAYDPYADPGKAGALGVHITDLDAVLSGADYLSVHTPLTRETHHIIDERALRAMKPRALLVNTSRGPVVDEQALIRALKEGWIAGAGLDVFETEPIAPDNPLKALDNVVLTPHIAGYSDETTDNSWRLSVDTAVDLAHGRWPRSYVNRDVTPRWHLTAPDSL
jgi:D-3-phosphoglycerate dehydrogenase